MVTPMSEMTQMPLPRGGSRPPEWIHLLPQGAFPAMSGAKTLRATSMDAIIAASMAAGKLVLDENHSTDFAAPRGKASPAMGWIEAMDVRSDGLWGRVRWTKRGRTLMEDHAYRSVSPVLVSTPDGTVTRILRAALTNTPDLSLKTLHSRITQQEGSAMTYPLAELRTRLGLRAEADNAAINHALDHARGAVSLHSRTASLAGLAEDATSDAIVTALKKQQETVTLHSAAEAGLQKQIDDLKAANATMAAENWVAEAGRKKIINDVLRGQLVTLHSSNVTLAENVVASLPDAPSAQTTLHSGTTHNGSLTKNAPSMTAANAALGLTMDDLKAGGLS